MPPADLAPSGKHIIKEPKASSNRGHFLRQTRALQSLPNFSPDFYLFLMEPLPAIGYHNDRSPTSSRRRRTVSGMAPQRFPFPSLSFALPHGAAFLCFFSSFSYLPLLLFPSGLRFFGARSFVAALLRGTPIK